jgi:predicted component of type VI protein secretion system
MPRDFDPRNLDLHDRQKLSGPHIRQTLPDVSLEILRGRARQRVRVVAGPAFLIGSAGDSDLVLGDPQFPEAHCYLLLSPEDVALRWLGIGPEVFVNDRPVRKTRLADGDVLRTGTYEFRVGIDRRMATPRLSRPQPARPEPKPKSPKPSRAPRSVEWTPSEGGETARQEVRQLLADIRRALEPNRPLRVFAAVGMK